MVVLAGPAEQKVILTGISWDTYERLLAEHEAPSATRFTYDRGVLEIMVLSARHERPNRVLALLVEVVAEELSLDVQQLGSTTFRRRDLGRGFEADSTFYLQRAAAVAGKEEIDLTVDPPPDLVIEIDVTRPSLEKLPLYAAVGVPEIWRYDGERVAILRLEGTRYLDGQPSLALPPLTGEVATRLLEQSTRMPRPQWLHHVREWVRSARRA